MLQEMYISVVMSADPTIPLVNDPRYTVSNDSLRRLRPGTWLNDELINAYVSLVNTRLRAQKSGPRMLCLNSFFMTKLEADQNQGIYSFKKLQKWI